jgi:hypothetical protein
MAKLGQFLRGMVILTLYVVICSTLITVAVFTALIIVLFTIVAEVINFILPAKR